MKVSIITVVYNNKEHIASCIKSVQQQSYNNIEHVIIDGNSTDGTKEYIQNNVNGKSIFISEPDKGMYDAMNKGIRNSTGDIIGILNSDDIFYDNEVIENVVSEFKRNDITALYGNIVFVKQNNLTDVIRTYSAKKFTPNKFAYGFMPPHPSFYAKRELFSKYGVYKEDYKIAADYELLIRLLAIEKIKCAYVEFFSVRMRMGGASNKNLKSVHLLNKEIVRACRENGIKTNIGLVYFKYLKKIFEFVNVKESKVKSQK